MASGANVKMDMTAANVWGALKVGSVISVSGGAATAAAAAAGLTPAAAIVPVAVLLACFAAAMHYWKTHQAQLLAEYSRMTRQRFSELQQQVAETQGLVQLGRIALPYPLSFGGDYALTADAAAVLARQVALRRPKVVVELGSGVSTVLVGKLLQDLSCGRIYSLEHDSAWAEETRKQVRAAGLQAHVEVLDAPLGEQQVDGHAFPWYEIPAKLKEVGQIALLIVDGPPQRIDPEGLPRYPALPKFLPQLSENTEIFVDDAKRPAEQEMIRRWLERFAGWEVRTLETVPGTCLLSRSSRGGTGA